MFAESSLLRKTAREASVVRSDPDFCRPRNRIIVASAGRAAICLAKNRAVDASSASFSAKCQNKSWPLTKYRLHRLSTNSHTADPLFCPLYSGKWILKGDLASFDPRTLVLMRISKTGRQPKTDWHNALNSRRVSCRVFVPSSVRLSYVARSILIVSD